MIVSHLKLPSPGIFGPGAEICHEPIDRPRRRSLGTAPLIRSCSDGVYFDSKGPCPGRTIGKSRASLLLTSAGAAPPCRCRRSQHRLLRGGHGGRTGRGAPARFSVRHPCLCRRGADAGRERLPHHRSLSARIWSTRFRDPATPRSGEQAAIGADLIALMDALAVKRAVLAGYDWGGRAACVAAALWPDRCIGLVSVNGYLVQDIAKAMVPARPEREVPLWYQYYFQFERGRAGLAANRRGIARILWQQWSPNWHFDDATFERSAVAFDNPDYVDVVIHSYRHRFGLADGDPHYADLQRRLAVLPVITVPAITLDGDGDGVVPATDGTASAPKFSGRRSHHVIPHAGHNLPQEEPEAFAAAVMALIKA